MPDEHLLHSALGVSTRSPSRVRVDDRDDLTFGVGSPEQQAQPDRATPEQLYAAAVASCLHQSLLIEASEVGVDTANSTVSVEVRLRHAEGRRFELSAVASVELPDADERTGHQLASRALDACPMAGQVTTALA